jgi:hypothetical protein
MVRNLVKMALGPYGRAVLEFYEMHSLVINLCVIAYGVLILACWRNLQSIRASLVASIAESLEAAAVDTQDLGPDDILSNLIIDWDKAARSAPFPWVAGRLAWWPRRVSQQSLKSLIDEGGLVKDAMGNPRS